MEITKDKITEIFCIIDDFGKEYDAEIEKMAISEPNGGKRIRDASIYTSKKISLKFLFLSDIFLFPFIRQQFPVLT